MPGSPRAPGRGKAVGSGDALKMSLTLSALPHGPPLPRAPARRTPYASLLVPRNDAPPRRRRRPIRRIERALIGGVMAVIAFFVERLVVRSLKRSGGSSGDGK